MIIYSVEFNTKVYKKRGGDYVKGKEVQGGNI